MPGGGERVDRRPGSPRGQLSLETNSFAWLIDTWRRAREKKGWVRLTLHELGMDLYGFHPGGKQSQAMRARADAA